MVKYLISLAMLSMFYETVCFYLTLEINISALILNLFSRMRLKLQYCYWYKNYSTSEGWNNFTKTRSSFMSLPLHSA